jgi:hypothetical protein
MIGALAERNEQSWQLPDGPGQQKRDEMMKKIPMGAAQNWDGKHIDEPPGLPPNPLFWPWVYGHDVIDFVSDPRSCLLNLGLTKCRQTADWMKCGNEGRILVRNSAILVLHLEDVLMYCSMHYFFILLTSKWR